MTGFHIIVSVPAASLIICGGKPPTAYENMETRLKFGLKSEHIPSATLKICSSALSS